MNAARIIGGLAMVLSAVLSLTNVGADEPRSRGTSLATVEGIVASVETISSEGSGHLYVARITVDEAEPRELTIVLAPESTLRQIDFEVQAGDRLRARIFLSDDASVLAHKVMNVTRGTMVRLRTLTRIPLWDGNGQWQGGPCRAHRGGPDRRGPRH